MWFTSPKSYRIKIDEKEYNASMVILATKPYLGTRVPLYSPGVGESGCVRLLVYKAPTWYGLVSDWLGSFWGGDSQGPHEQCLQSCTIDKDAGVPPQIDGEVQQEVSHITFRGEKKAIQSYLPDDIS